MSQLPLSRPALVSSRRPVNVEQGRPKQSTTELNPTISKIYQSLTPEERLEQIGTTLEELTERREHKKLGKQNTELAAHNDSRSPIILKQMERLKDHIGTYVKAYQKLVMVMNGNGSGSSTMSCGPIVSQSESA